MNPEKSHRRFRLKQEFSRQEHAALRLYASRKHLSMAAVLRLLSAPSLRAIVSGGDPLGDLPTADQTFEAAVASAVRKELNSPSPPAGRSS